MILAKSVKDIIVCGILCVPFMLHADNSNNWEGQYVGFSLGHSNIKANFNSTIQGTTYFNAVEDAPQMNPILSEDLNEDNLSGSIIWGINKQNGNLVYGLETDLTLLNYNEQSDTGNVNYDSVPTDTFRVQNELKSNILFSLRPRIGYSTKKALFFLSAGPAVTYIDYKFEFEETLNNDSDSFHEKNWKLGWSGSVGSEYMLDNDWTLKLEYLYYKFNDVVDGKSQLAVNSGDGFNHDVDLEINTFRIGFTKKF